MSLYIEYTHTLVNYIKLDLPDDVDLLEVELLEESDLPDEWDKKTFTVKDLLDQDKKFITETISHLEYVIGHNYEIEEYIKDNQSSFSEPEINITNYDYNGG